MLIYTTHQAVSLQAKSHCCLDLDADGVVPC
jgi:hypothetical protein